VPSGKRQHFDDEGKLSAESRFETVSIGAGCWIGEGAIVLADVGERCVISAGAVVTKAVPGHSIAGGNPAKVLRALEEAA
jgi:acetyltransferase-like isoleucine patch superfamily enzyme